MYSCGLYYKHITIVNDGPSVVNKFEASLTDDTRGIIHDRHMFIVQATVINAIKLIFFVIDTLKE
jgi:hypothetical protein